MLLDKHAFTELRSDTYALCIHDPSIYYYYAKALLTFFVERASSLVDLDDLQLSETAINEELQLVRDTHLSRSRIVDTESLNVLAEIDASSETRVSAFRTGSVTARCHTETGTTIKLPTHVSTLSSTKISSSREAANVETDLFSISSPGNLADFVSATRVAEILGGAVSDRTVISSGDGEDLLEYIDAYQFPYPAKLEVLIHDTIVLPLSQTPIPLKYVLSLVLTAEDTSSGSVLVDLIERNVVVSWSAVRERVKLLSPGIGTVGPLFTYPLSENLVDLDLALTPGMCLKADSSVEVSKVTGQRVKLSAPTSLYGEHEFTYKGIRAWERYLPFLQNIKVSGETKDERESSLLEQVKRRVRACEGLISELPTTKNNIRFDIKAAHYAVGADVAYNLLERGKLIEYHQLTEQQAKRSSVMASAAAHIRAGTRL